MTNHHIAARKYTFVSILGIFLLAMLVVGPISSRAQVTNATGTIQGTVTDQTGAVVPNAKVTLTEPSTGFKKVFATTGDGYYSSGSLTPGVYHIQIEASGFSTAGEDLTVQVGVAANGSLKLAVGTGVTQVQVQANAVQVDTQQTQIAGVLTRQQIANLPLNGRNFLDLAQLQPGVQIQDGTNFDPTKNGFSSISFGGRFGRTARIELDGLDISDENVGTTTQNISENAIQEFQVAQSNLDITTSITSSGSVNIVSRSGSNAIHGDALYNFRDKRAGGANFPDGQDNYLQRNNVSGGVGGAFIPDKMFYFFSAENTVQHLAAPVSLAGTALSNFDGSYSAPYSEMELLGRFDFNLFHGAHGFIRGAYHNNKDVGGFGGGNNYSPYLNTNNTPNVGGGLDFLTGNFSHSFRVGYFKFVNHITDATSVTANPAFNLTPGINLVIGPYSTGANDLAPQTTVQSNKQFKYDGSWTKGTHTLRYGVGVNHLLGGGFASFFGLAPQVSAVLGSGSDPSNPLTYELGPSSGTTTILGNGQGYDTEIPQFGFPGGGQEDWRFTAYLGDQWKITPRINFNYGLRYIRDTGRTDSDLPALPNSGTTPPFSVNDVSAGLGDPVTQPNHNFGPQAGIAWDLTGRGKTVIRAGAGIYYENNVWNNVLFDRPTRLASGLFWGNTTICDPTSITAGNTTLTTIDGTPGGTSIASLCGQPLGTTVGEHPVYQDVAILQQTYQKDVAAAGAAANGSYIYNTLAEGPDATGDEPFYPKYKTPLSYQMNIGIQQALGPNTVITVDYLRNIGIHFLTAIDQNHVGQPKYFNLAAAQAAVAYTVAACGVATVQDAIQACPGLHPATATTPVGGATISDFAATPHPDGSLSGIGTLNDSNDGFPGSTFAFQGKDPNFGQLYFLEPSARSSYNALDVQVTQRARHPVKGIISSDLTVSYSYGHFNGTGTNANTAVGGSGGDQDFGSIAIDQNDPNHYYGPNSLDRRQQFSVGLDAEVLKGLRLDTIAHLYSSLPLTLSLPTQGAGDTFISDVDGDGTVGDVLPGTNIGSFMRTLGPQSINKAIDAYNSKYAGTLTPTGTAVVNSGVLTLAQMQALGGVMQKVYDAPSDQVGNDIMRIWDLGLSYDFHVGEGLTVSPSVHAFNVLNAANFDAPGTLGATRESGILTNALNPATGTANNTTAASQAPYRIGLGTGVYSFGAPRQLEFGLKLNF